MTSEQSLGLAFLFFSLMNMLIIYMLLKVSDIVNPEKSDSYSTFMFTLSGVAPFIGSFVLFVIMYQLKDDINIRYNQAID